MSAASREAAAARRKRAKIIGARARAAAPPQNPPVRRDRGARLWKYDPAETPELARKYAMLGLNEAEIAAALRVSESAITAWKRRYPEFAKQLEDGKLIADAEVANSLYMRAKGGLRMPAVKIFLPKDAKKPVYAPYEEVLAPDVNAARLWLTNRQPRFWRDRREVEVSGGIEHQISVLSAEDRAARLQALLAQAGQIIEGEAIEVGSSDDTGEDEAGN